MSALTNLLIFGRNYNSKLVICGGPKTTARGHDEDLAGSLHSYCNYRHRSLSASHRKAIDRYATVSGARDGDHERAAKHAGVRRNDGAAGRGDGGARGDSAARELGAGRDTCGRVFAARTRL